MCWPCCSGLPSKELPLHLPSSSNIPPQPNPTQARLTVSCADTLAACATSCCACASSAAPPPASTSRVTSACTPAARDGCIWCGKLWVALGCSLERKQQGKAALAPCRFTCWAPALPRLHSSPPPCHPNLEQHASSTRTASTACRRSPTNQSTGPAGSRRTGSSRK